MGISTLGWIVVGVLAWMAVAAVVGVLVGRMIRIRDRQVPRDTGPDDRRRGFGPADHVPHPRRAGPDEVPHRAGSRPQRVTSRGRLRRT